MDEQKQKELIKLLANSENIFAAIRIHDSYTEILNRVINTELEKQVTEIANELGLELKFRPREDIGEFYWQQQYSHFFLGKEEWKNAKICFEFKSANFNKLSYGIRYNSPKAREENEEIRRIIQDRIHGGRSEEWWAYIKDFKYSDWRREYVYRELYNNKNIQEEMRKCIQSLIDLTEGIAL